MITVHLKYSVELVLFNRITSESIHKTKRDENDDNDDEERYKNPTYEGTLNKNSTLS